MVMSFYLQYLKYSSEVFDAKPLENETADGRNRMLYVVLYGYRF